MFCLRVLSSLFQFSVFEYTYLLWWNVFWSLCPVIAMGVFDRITGEHLHTILRFWGLFAHVHASFRRRHPYAITRVVSLRS